MTNLPRRFVAVLPLATWWLAAACADTEPERATDTATSGGRAGAGAVTGGASGAPVAGAGTGGAAGGGAGSAAGTAPMAGGPSGGAGAATSGTGGAGAASGGAGATGGTAGAGTGNVGGASGGVAGATNVAGGGSAGTSAAGGAGSAGAGAAGAGPACALPASLAWSASAPLIVPRSDASHDLVAVKDPTVVRFDDRWHVYASSVSTTGVYGMVYTSFADWSDTSNASWYYMDQTPGFDTYVAAPQVFYFRPGNKWYLLFQSGPPMWSSSDDPGDPTKWTRPAPFYASEPPIVTENDGWLDYWVICDSTHCHLFFSDDHGRWYKSKTPIGSFPNGFDQPVIVMQDAEAGRLFEGSNVYKVAGSHQYLALIEAFDATSNWRRYFRSFTAPSLEGPWTPYLDSGSVPFAGMQNSMFTGTPWANDISHGELVRAGYDETLTLDPCDLRFLFQGYDPAADGSDYNKLPWKLGLLSPR